MNIKLRVNNLIKKHGTTNPFLLAAYLGIDILYLPLPDHIRGFLVRALRRKIIIINDMLSEEAVKIVICHELGHARLHIGYGYYLHPNSTYYIPSRREKEANEFALFLLSHSNDFDGELVSRILREKNPNPREVHKILGALLDL